MQSVFRCLFFYPSANQISLKWLKGQLLCTVMASCLCYKSCSLFPPWVLRLTVAMVSKVEKGEAETCMSPFSKKEKKSYSRITICRWHHKISWSGNYDIAWFDNMCLTWAFFLINNKATWTSKGMWSFSTRGLENAISVNQLIADINNSSCFSQKCVCVLGDRHSTFTHCDSSGLWGLAVTKHWSAFPAKLPPSHPPQSLSTDHQSALGPTVPPVAASTAYLSFPATPLGRVGRPSIIAEENLSSFIQPTTELWGTWAVIFEKHTVGINLHFNAFSLR